MANQLTGASIDSATGTVTLNQDELIKDAIALLTRHMGHFQSGSNSQSMLA